MHAIMTRRVCVIGAGVIGLSTALNVIQNIDDVTVTIVAEHVTPNTTSDGAGGFWQPYLMGVTPIEKLRMWGEETYEHLVNLSSSPGAGHRGVFLVSGDELFHQETSDPFWSDIVLHFRHLTSRELHRYPGVRSGISYTTAVCECKKYLPWLMERFTACGGNIVRKKVNTFEELYPDYDIIVNCSGLGAARLCSDDKLVPTKGQVIKVSAPWIKQFVVADDIDAYILINTDQVILGGTRVPGVSSKDVDIDEKRRIWTECCKLIPSLQNSEVIGDWVGLRPSRPSVRLETEERRWRGRTIKIVHNYGHGGGGITFHWGCAKEATELVKSSLRHHTAAKL